MHIRLLTISLIMSITLVQAADDITLSLANFHRDESPAGYMQRLRADEARVVDDISGKCIFQKDRLLPTVEYVLNNLVNLFVEKNGLVGYFNYFKALASTKKLSDEQKLQSCYVEIPPMRVLKEKTKEERQKVLDGLMDILEYNSMYPIARLLLGTLCEFDVDLNKEYRFFNCNTLLHRCLRKDDLPLIQKLLQHGANPNAGYSTLACCKSVQAAQLCLTYGACFIEQHKKVDLIWHVCSSSGEDVSPNVLSLFLPYAPLDESNEFGKKWFDILKRYPRNATVERVFERIERISILLKAGCHYDEKQIQRLVSDIELSYIYPPDNASNRVMLINKIAILAQGHKKRKNLTDLLRERALTGKPLEKRVTNLYEKMFGQGKDWQPVIKAMAIEEIKTLVAQDYKIGKTSPCE